MRMTLLDIENAERFFEMLKECSGPVTVSAAGCCEDIRENKFLHALLMETGKNGQIARLEVNVEAAGDLPIFCHYMMGARA